MSEYVFKPSRTDDFELDEHDATNPVDWYGTLHGEIVRCRDCRYYEPNTYSHFTCELLAFHVQSDGFCAWSELREG